MTSFIEILKNNLIGKKLRHLNIYNREVSLEIEDVQLKEIQKEITPPTIENDWYDEYYEIVRIEIKFVDGSTKQYDISSFLNLE